MENTPEQEVKYEGRCMRCKMQKQITNPAIVTMKTGMRAVKGTCAVCGTKIFRILPKQK